MLYKLIAVAAGGALGTVLRYLITGWSQQLITERFPVGTLIVNVVGCFALGLLAPLFLAGRIPWREEYRFLLLTGVLGGFTTFSTFGYESISFTNDGQHGLALVNIALNNIVGLAAAWLGYRLAVTYAGA